MTSRRPRRASYGAGNPGSDSFRERIYQDLRGGVIRHEAAKELTRERITALQVGKYHDGKTSCPK